MTASTRMVTASEMADHWRRASNPPVDETQGSAPGTETETWAERVYGALPLFIVGGICLVVAIDLYYSGVTTQLNGNTVRLSPWVLFLALAVTGIAAGVFSLFLEEAALAPAEAEVAAKPTATPAPVWDESTVVPTKPAYVRPRTWERYPEFPEGVGWSPAEPRVERVPPDVVLIQIDEIAASLRKKTPPPSSP